MNLCKLIGHKYETTHINAWLIPTRRECKRCKRAEVTTGIELAMEHFGDMTHPDCWQAETETEND